MTAEPNERLVDWQLLTFGDHSLGLSDGDAAVKRNGELGVQLTLLMSVRLCMMAMVASSARAWATDTSSSIVE